MAKYTRVLCIDGGGIRGIIPGQVLVALEDKLQKRMDDSTVRIADYFDMIAGTSTGGILTCLYLCPDQKRDSMRPRFSARQAVDLYINRGKDIFDISLWQKIRSVHGIRDEKYDATELENALQEYFEDTKLSDLLKPCLITTYDIEDRRTRFFASHTAKNKTMYDYLVRDVARATSAAPTYFETAYVYSASKVPYPLIDGGVFANNPSMCAYAEIRSEFKKTAKDMVMLSLGTGSTKNEYNYKDAKDWGLINWVGPLIDIMMSGVSETVDYQLRQIFESVQRPHHYLRIDTDLKAEYCDMDNSSKENITALCEIGTRAAEKSDAQLDAFIELLIREPGPHRRKIDTVSAISESTEKSHSTSKKNQ